MIHNPFLIVSKRCQMEQKIREKTDFLFCCLVKRVKLITLFIVAVGSWRGTAAERLYFLKLATLAEIETFIKVFKSCNL